MRVARCLPLVLLLPLSQPGHSGDRTTVNNGSHNIVGAHRTQDSTASPTTNPLPRHAASAPATGFLGVLTYHNNNLRTGLNAQETILTPTNVNSSQFGKLFTYNLRGQQILGAFHLHCPRDEQPRTQRHGAVERGRRVFLRCAEVPRWRVLSSQASLHGWVDPFICGRNPGFRTAASSLRL